jgi:uncharacterized protein
MKRAFLVLLLAIATMVGAAPARAAPFTPPPLHGHVIDGTNTLTDDQRAKIDERLESFRLRTGYAIVAFIVPSLEGNTIEDVAYETFNTWKIGEEGKDNGILLVLAPNERKSRIETGKGVGGELTDLESAEILRGYVTPQMRAGDLYKAVDDGTSALEKALSDELPITNVGPNEAPTPVPTMGHWLFIAAIVLLALLAIVSPTFRWVLLGLLQSMIFSRGGGRGGGGFGGGGGYSGGGGSSGGGGASDSY